LNVEEYCGKFFSFTGTVSGVFSISLLSLLIMSINFPNASSTFVASFELISAKV